MGGKLSSNVQSRCGPYVCGVKRIFCLEKLTAIWFSRLGICFDKEFQILIAAFHSVLKGVALGRTGILL